MSNPDDDTDVPSGFDDDARMERTPSRTSDTSAEGEVAGGGRAGGEAQQKGLV